MAKKSAAPVASYRDRDDWLEMRRSGIGGSDASAILGVNPYSTPRDVWLDKVGKGVDVEVTAPMKRGIYLEPIAADVYAEETGRTLRRQPLVRHKEHEFIIGNADRQILAVGDVTATGVLEIKCPGLYTMSNVRAHGLPDYMIVQLMHYLAVYGYEWGSFGLFNAENWKLVHFDLEADKDLIEQIIEAEVKFWEDHVIPQIEPPVDVEVEIEVPEVEGELTVIDDPEWRKAAYDLRDARELKKAATGLEDQAKDKLKGLMDAQKVTAIEIPDLVRIKYSLGKPSTSWKNTAIKLAKHAGVKIDDFVVRGKASKGFYPYFLKGGPSDV
ncbi:hypothetical protein ES705_36791 [subsurface metagenome]